MRTLPVFLLFLLLAPAAHAWSEFGHSLVGELAYRRLSPAARAEVDALLRDEPVPTLAGVAAWADTIRDLPEYKHTGPFHYVQIGDAGCVFERARDCRGEACVVGAIEHYRAILADAARPPAARAEALKFVVHFVGDVHQPLHAGHRADKGGNQFQIQLDGEGTNLHSVWDHHVLRSADLDFAQWVERLSAAPAQAAGQTPAQWAEASCRKTNEAGFYPARPGNLPPAYLDAHRAYAERRLREAAAELAAILEADLTGD
jgi:hypothetical protein